MSLARPPAQGPPLPKRSRRSPLGALTIGGLLCSAIGLAGPGCGARSSLDVPPPLPPFPECDVTEDCPGYQNLCAPVTCIDPDDYEGELPPLPAGVQLPPRVCLPLEPVDCDDNDPCTTDDCTPSTGLCTYGPSTFDNDGDGHRGFLAGTVAGEPGSCGDDCDDYEPAAFPGNPEICDGVDNDCNGIIDDNATFVPLVDEPVRISGDIAPAETGGLAFNGETYLAIYSGTNQGFDMYETRLDPLGNKLDPIEQPVAVQNADSYGGPLMWTGDRYGLAWQDRRDGDYEIYFTTLDAWGDKIIPDRRLTFAYGFSVNVDMAYNGSEFIVVWEDERSGQFEIMGQRVSLEGEPMGNNVRLTQDAGFLDEAPAIAMGTEGAGVAWANGYAGFQVIKFRIYDFDTLEPISPMLDLTDGSTEAVYPQIAWNGDHYLVAWYDKTASTKGIYGATISAEGEIILPVTPLSNPGAFRSRHPFLLPLGDRTQIVYADDRDQNDGYELYTVMVDADLEPIGTEQRLTTAPFHSIYPKAAFGPEGDIGILFRDEREAGDDHIWFTRLGCLTNSN